jgi:hypothetical protein
VYELVVRCSMSARHAEFKDATPLNIEELSMYSSISSQEGLSSQEGVSPEERGFPRGAA